jgi:protein-tyrosine phosphatase
MSIISKIFGGKPSMTERSGEGAQGPFLVDIHSHLLPGIDDGVKSWEEAIEVVRAFQDLGYKKLITTPHVMADHFHNEADEIVRLCEELNNRLSKEGIEMEVAPSGEYYLDEGFDKLVKEKKLLSFGDGYVLVETAFMAVPDSFKASIFNAKIAGYQPILAHPERYTYLYGNFDKCIELFDLEILFQLNLASLAGYYSKDAKKTAERLIKEKMVHFVGSDAHGMRHLDAVRDAMKTPAFSELAKLPIRNNELLSLTTDRPATL